MVILIIPVRVTVTWADSKLSYYFSVQDGPPPPNTHTTFPPCILSYPLNKVAGKEFGGKMLRCLCIWWAFVCWMFVTLFVNCLYCQSFYTSDIVNSRIVHFFYMFLPHIHMISSLPDLFPWRKNAHKQLKVLVKMWSQILSLDQLKWLFFLKLLIGDFWRHYVVKTLVCEKISVLEKRQGADAVYMA